MMRKSGYSFHGFLVVVWFVFGAFSATAAGVPGAESQGEDILEATGVKGGLVVHIGCGDGRLTRSLRANDSLMVQGLAVDAGDVDEARAYLQAAGIYGAVTVDRFSGGSLPYIDNLVNLVVSDNLGAVSMKEVMRVLCPDGVAYIKQGNKWVMAVKPRPEEIDEWTHYLYDASNNAVAHDTVIGPPRRMQWVGSPRQSRHHDRMSSVSAAVSAGGRVFYIIDEATPVSILVAPQWSLIARDAFNGTVLWKRPIANWHPHLWPLKSGPAQLPRRLVAVGDRVYVTLGIDAAVSALDAATGKTVRTYHETAGAEEIIFSDGVLFVLVNGRTVQTADSKKIGQGYGAKFWDESPRELVAVRTAGGRILWSDERTVLPGTLAADAESVYFHDGRSVVCLHRRTGKERWRSGQIARSEIIRGFYVPILVVCDDVVLFSGGETAGAQTGSWYREGKDTMTALSAKTGKELWTAHHPPSGYRSPEDLLVVDGLVWTGETTSGRAEGLFTGRDFRTGQVKRQFEPDVDIYWFHHRCYRGKATDNYLLMSRTGTEFVDVRNEQWLVNHWVRGACLYGIMPANGMLYNPPNPCACYLESKVDGFNALAPASAGPRIDSKLANAPRLEKGPAWDNIKPMNITKDDWPTYRHDGARSGSGSAVSTNLTKAWRTDIGGKLTSPVIAGDMVFVASVDAHIVAAIDAASGRQQWRYTAGGRVDSAPTIWKGRVLFGCRDGWVYCLRASDGKLAWRFRAAPMDERLTAFEQIESVWPVHGSVLVHNDVLYCVAGRSRFLDGGLRFLRLDPATGRLLSETVLDERELGTDKHIHEYVTWLNMPPALPDILSTDGRLVYMRGLPLDMDGAPLPLEKFPPGADLDAGAPPATQRADRAHLYSPTGFVDDSWWHRTYWMYGSRFVSGWCGYYLSGKAAPAGRILCFDEDKVYGFGRKPQYYRWTTPIEHHLFAADKTAGATKGSSGPGASRSFIEVAKSKSLNPAGKAITVEAWIKPDKNSGVIIARGGASLGYVLYLQNGRLRFGVRAEGVFSSVNARTKIGNEWTHVAGVLTEDRKLHIYVNGKLAASAKASGLIGADPSEVMQIGADKGSTVGEYNSGLGFNGLIDEVRVYHRALRADEIARSASILNKRAIDKTGMVLCYTFNDKGFLDVSGNENNGEGEGVKSVRGVMGRAMKFTGTAGTTRGFKVRHDWTRDLPIFARAMVLADKTIFVAGPPDLVDEPRAFAQIDEAQIKESLIEQAAAIEGKKGAVLMAVSTADPDESTQYQLDSPPVFDGMAAAGGRLYMSTVDGKVLCMSPDKQTAQK